jgi:hypothetical protein
MSEYALHPEAFTDLDDIRALVASPHQGYRRPNPTSRPLRFKLVRERTPAPLRPRQFLASSMRYGHLVEAGGTLLNPEAPGSYKIIYSWSEPANTSGKVAAL